MDPSNNSRIVKDLEYPHIVYLEALAFFMGANYLFHLNVFRVRNNKP
jgi:hypothetical protein